jgi:CRP/FNR family transcriptional regulator
LSLLNRKSEHYECNFLDIIQETLAQVLVTIRKVIAILLKKVEKLGRLKLYRNKIELITIGRV